MPHTNHKVTVNGEEIVIPDVAKYQAEQTAAAHAKVKGAVKSDTAADAPKPKKK